MCDYSILHSETRPARVGDELKVHNFGSLTNGFADAYDDRTGSGATAICVLPGTELAFERTIRCQELQPLSQLDAAPQVRMVDTGVKLARFRQINKDQPHAHHDALELADGRRVLLTHLAFGQIATVLQLPAAPKNDAEAAEQRRLEVVG